MKEKIKTDTQSSSLDRVMPPTENLGGEIFMKRKINNMVLGTLGLKCLCHSWGSLTDNYLNVKGNLGRGYRFGAPKTIGVVKKSEFNFGHREFQGPLECGHARPKLRSEVEGEGF